MENEIWRDVEGYEGDYMISNLGRVKSFVKYKEGRILKPSLSMKEYLNVGLSKNNEKKTMNVHRLVAIAFLENPENKEQVNHINNIRNDNRLENLEWATNKENSQHMINQNRGNQPKREKHHNAKLTEKDISEIRENKNNLYQRELGEIYGVSKQQISRIINKKSWK